MTKAQEIEKGLKAHGWEEDTSSRVTKGKVWRGGMIPIKGYLPAAECNANVRIYTGPSGSCRLSLSGKKTESTPLSEKTIAAFIAAGRPQ
jgi:hypothetical protein